MAPSPPDSAPARPVYETDLVQTPLPEILVTVHRYSVPGAITCRRGNERKEIFVDAGRIVFATSNQVRDSLGDRLLNEGRITREQYDESVRRLLVTGRRQGTILTEMEVLDRDAMVEAVRDQIQEIVWSVFAWEAGAVTFTPGRDRLQEFVKLDIPIPRAVIEGARRMPDAKLVLARIGTKTTLVVPTNHAIEGLTFSEDETRLLEAVDGKRSLGDLVAIPPLAPGVNARLLYALFVLQLISVKSQGIRVKVSTDRGTRPVP